MISSQQLTAVEAAADASIMGAVPACLQGAIAASQQSGYSHLDNVRAIYAKMSSVPGYTGHMLSTRHNRSVPGLEATPTSRFGTSLRVYTCASS